MTLIGGEQEKNKYSRSAGAYILRFANEIEEPKETGQTKKLFGLAVPSRKDIRQIW